ncbi:MAG: helix-turn-helix domain-containing protein [Clostridiales bacterium]|nr:helix-turn-helix domain-containing protein [Clostridiales bacterium]
MTLGEKIWRLRESRHMSQEELAEKLGVSRQTVSNWENDKAVLDAEKLAKLCTVFGVSADDMLNGEEIPQPIVQISETASPSERKEGKRLFSIVFAVIAVILIIIAAVGLIVSDDKASVSSLITFHSDFVWIALFVLGGAAFIGAVIAFLKKK